RLVRDVVFDGDDGAGCNIELERADAGEEDAGAEGEPGRAIARTGAGRDRAAGDPEVVEDLDGTAVFDEERAAEARAAAGAGQPAVASVRTADTGRDGRAAAAATVAAVTALEVGAAAAPAITARTRLVEARAATAADSAVARQEVEPCAAAAAATAAGFHARSAAAAVLTAATVAAGAGLGLSDRNAVAAVVAVRAAGGRMAEATAATERPARSGAAGAAHTAAAAPAVARHRAAGATGRLAVLDGDVADLHVDAFTDERRAAKSRAAATRLRAGAAGAASCDRVGDRQVLNSDRDADVRAERPHRHQSAELSRSREREAGAVDRHPGRDDRQVARERDVRGEADDVAFLHRRERVAQFGLVANGNDRLRPGRSGHKTQNRDRDDDERVVGVFRHESPTCARSISAAIDEERIDRAIP